MLYRKKKLGLKKNYPREKKISLCVRVCVCEREGERSPFDQTRYREWMTAQIIKRKEKHKRSRWEKFTAKREKMSHFCWKAKWYTQPQLKIGGKNFLRIPLYHYVRITNICECCLYQMLVKYRKISYWAPRNISSGSGRYSSVRRKDSESYKHCQLKWKKNHLFLLKERLWTIWQLSQKWNREYTCNTHNGP